jgi:uncharacterized protein (TIGR02996 family)
MERPTRLPATVDDLGEWTVYADWLQTKGDPRGTAIALELAAPEPRQEVRDGLGLALRLGYIHTLDMPREHSNAVSAEQIARVRSLLAADDATLLEEIHVALEPKVVGEMCGLFAALPASCRRLAAASRRIYGRTRSSRRT